MEKLRISKIPADARAKEENSPLSTRQRCTPLTALQDPFEKDDRNPIREGIAHSYLEMTFLLVLGWGGGVRRL